MGSRSTIWLYGGLMGVLLVILQFIEFKFFVREIQPSLLILVLAVIFTGMGAWLGLRIKMKGDRRKPQLEAGEVEKRLEILEITPREFEVLQLIAKGYSNQQIADSLHISLSTVKTHVSRIFSKLDVRRRTQLVRKARELDLVV